MNIPAGIAAELALAQQAVALSVIKQNADAQKQVADVIAQAAQSVPASSSHGNNVNISA